MQLLQALATMMVAVHAGRGGNGNGNGNGMGGTDGPTSHPTSRPTTSYPTAIPTAIDPGTFKVRTAGNCNGATHLQTAEQCAEAGRALGLLDTTPITLTNTAAMLALPAGCHYDTLRSSGPLLVWNPRAADGTYQENVTRPRLSICTNADAVPFRITSASGGSRCRVVGNCVTDGAGTYVDNEDCRLVMLRSGTLSALVLKVEVWNGCSADYFQIGNTKHCGEAATDFAALQNVSVSIGTELQWIADGSIVREGYTVCFKEDATTAPTAMPTASPSKNPTRHPTGAPSTQPTRGPTDVPSTYPTLGPVTDAPTRAGETFAPTTTPTRNPSATPTTPPTSAPTGTPTGNPTAYPTTSPVSSRPSSAPSINPTPGIAVITLAPTSAGFVASTKRPTPAPTACVRDCGGDDDYFNDEDDVPAASPVSPPSPPAPPPAETANAGVTIDEESQSAVVVVIIVVFVVVGILVAVVILQKKRLDASSKGSGGHNVGFGFFGVDMKTIKGAEVLANAARPAPKKKKKKKKPTVPARKTADTVGIVNQMYEEPVGQAPGWEAGDGMYDVPQERPAPAASDAYSVPKKKKKKKPTVKTANDVGIVNQEPGWEAGDGMYDVPQERSAPSAKKRTASVVSRIDNTEALYDLGTMPNNADEEFGGFNGSGDGDEGTFDEGESGDDTGYLDMDDNEFYAEPESAPAAEVEEQFGFE